MNMWGLTPEFLDILETGFVHFLENLKDSESGMNRQKSEYLLPIIVDNLIKEGTVSVKVLETRDRWFGATYAEDKDSVADSFKHLISDCVYNSHLW